MWMPGGTHHISAMKGNKTWTGDVQIDRQSAVEIQSQFENLKAASAHLPFFDFDHDDKAASFWPKEFYWKENPAPGIYTKGDWTSAGKDAIEGKTYRGFSPTFHVLETKGKPATVIAKADASLNFGGLVNRPAFKQIAPLWCKQAVRSKHEMSKEQSEKIAQLKGELESLQTKLKDAADPDKGEAQQEVTAKEIELVQAEGQAKIEELQGDKTKLEQQLYDRRTKDAEAEVKTAVARGAIAPKDEALQAKWKNWIIQDPEMAVALKATRGNGALKEAPITQRMVLRDNDSSRVSISRESNFAVLSKMVEINASNRNCPGDDGQLEKRKAAKRFAAIYASEIIPRLKDGDDMPLSASNSFGTLAATIASVRTLELLTLTFPMLQTISTDFSDQIVSYGDTLKTRYITIPAVATYNQTTGWATPSDDVTTDVSITYDQFKGVPITIDAQTIAGTIRRLFDEIAPAQAYALGKNMVDFVYALITAAHYPGVGAGVAAGGVAVAYRTAGIGTFGRSTLIDLAGDLDDNANPDIGRTMLLNRLYYSQIAKDPTIIQLAAFQRADMIYKGMEGTIADVEGFRIIKAVNLPATVISGASILKGFAYTKSGFVLASRLSADYMNILPGAGNGTLTVVSTPSGFSANQVQYVDNKLASANQRLEFIYGASAGQPNAGMILTDS